LSRSRLTQEAAKIDARQFLEWGKFFLNQWLGLWMYGDSDDACVPAWDTFFQSPANQPSIVRFIEGNLYPYARHGAPSASTEGKRETALKIACGIGTIIEIVEPSPDLFGRRAEYIDAESLRATRNSLIPEMIASIRQGIINQLFPRLAFAMSVALSQCQLDLVARELNPLMLSLLADVSHAYVLRFISEGALPAQKVGRDWIVAREDALNWLQERGVVL